MLFNPNESYIAMSEKILRLPEVMSRTGLSRSTIYVLLNKPQSDFPQSIKISVKAIGFIESEVDEWILSKIAASRDHKEKA